MLFDQGKLEKMTIRAFKPTTQIREVPQLSDAPEDSYVVQVNPSSYSLKQTIDYAKKKAQGTSGSDAVFNRSPARTVGFSFVFDATGVVPPPPSALTGIPVVGAIASALSDEEEYVVWEEIAKFDHVVYDYDGEMHRPRKVQLLWGSFSFSGALTELTYEFKLFRPDGTPLRATADCAFRGWLTDFQRALIEDKRSADLTHLRQVREGDRLPLMAHAVYGDPRHYIEVARHNRLVNFRRLAAGARIELPRLEGQETRR
jgi:nucleoid-associated protein YgaU